MCALSAVCACVGARARGRAFVHRGGVFPLENRSRARKLRSLYLSSAGNKRVVNIAKIKNRTTKDVKLLSKMRGMIAWQIFVRRYNYERMKRILYGKISKLHPRFHSKDNKQRTLAFSLSSRGERANLPDFPSSRIDIYNDRR